MRARARWAAAALVATAFVAAPSHAGRPRPPAIGLTDPPPNHQVTYAPLHIALDLDAAGTPSSLRVRLNGHDVTADFSFGAPLNGRVAATADFVWDGFVLPGANQIQVGYTVAPFGYQSRQGVGR